MILILEPARRKIYLHYRTRLISSFNHLICLPLLFLHRWKVRNNIVRGRVRWPDLAPWTICLYHKSVRRNGSDREKIFLCLQRAETRKTEIIGSFSFLLLFSSFSSHENHTVVLTIRWRRCTSLIVIWNSHPPGCRRRSVRRPASIRFCAFLEFARSRRWRYGSAGTLVALA